MKKDGIKFEEAVLSRKGQGERVKVLRVPGNTFKYRTVIWVHPDGIASLWKDGKLVPAARAAIAQGDTLIALDAFRTGEAAKSQRPTTNMVVSKLAYSGYFYGYNRSLVAERVHDILTTIAYAKERAATEVHLVGFEKAGPWRGSWACDGLCGATMAGRTAADVNGFRFEQVKDFDDEMMLPGALKYGGLLTLAGTIAPHELYLHNAKGAGASSHLTAAYQAAGQASKLERHDEKTDAGAVIQWLLR